MYPLPSEGTKRNELRGWSALSLGSRVRGMTGGTLSPPWERIKERGMFDASDSSNMPQRGPPHDDRGHDRHRARDSYGQRRSPDLR